MTRDVRRIRVVLVGPSLNILGGQAVQVQRLLRRLRELAGFDVDFLPINPQLPGPLRLLQRVKYSRTIFSSIAYVALLIWRLPRYDVVHAFSASYGSYLLSPLPSMVIARCYGKRVVLNYRSGEADDHLTRSWFARWTMKLAHEIVVPSGYLVEVFARHGLHARSIFNFVELDKIEYRERGALRPVFLSNRNLEPLYNVACTLRAFSLIQQQIPDAQLTVVGDGSQRRPLERLAAELALKNVVFVGKVPPTEMPGYYAAADVYLNSPNIDNMPNSVIEAYASGLPVVTTNAGGIPFIVRHEETGFMTECGDHAGLARHALTLLRDEAVATGVARRARDEAMSKYVWPAVSVEWERLYRALAASDAGAFETTASQAMERLQ